MQKELLKNVKGIIIGLVLALGVTSVSATTYTEPTGAPNANNVDALVYVNPVAQVKLGGLGVNAFSAFQNAAFEDDLYLKKFFTGYTATPNVSNSTTLKFGGTDILGTSREVNVSTTGDTYTSNGLYAMNIAGNMVSVCADGQGNLVGCANGAPTGPSLVNQVQVTTGFGGNPPIIQCVVSVTNPSTTPATYTVHFTFDSGDPFDHHIIPSPAQGTCEVTIPANQISGGTQFNADSAQNEYPIPFNVPPNASSVNDYCVSSASQLIPAGFECI